MPQFASAESVLFQQMVGKWRGEGIRVQVYSQRKTWIRAQTEALIVGEKLVSRNEITETAVNERNESVGPSRTYVRTYWIRPAGLASESTVNEAYEFGMGEGADEKITSQGTFQGGILEVNQNFGGDPPYIVRSLTGFKDGVSTYTEKVWHGDAQLTDTRIEYRKTLD